MRDKAYQTAILEEWRDSLNEEIRKSNYDLTDPAVIALSGKVDLLVLNEMRGGYEIA